MCWTVLYRLVPLPSCGGVEALSLSSCNNSTIRPPAGGVPSSLLAGVGVCALPLISSPFRVASSAALSLSSEELSGTVHGSTPESSRCAAVGGLMDRSNCNAALVPSRRGPVANDGRPLFPQDRNSSKASR
jgi:hypothetical protein